MLVIPGSLLEREPGRVKGLPFVEDEEGVPSLHWRPAAVPLALEGRLNNGVLLSASGNEGGDAIEWRNAALAKPEMRELSKSLLGHGVSGDA